MKTTLNIFLIILLFGLCLLQKNHLKLPEVKISLEEKLINANKVFSDLFHLGHANFISSVLYITTMLDADTDRKNNPDSASWLYLRFSTITDLTPHFYEAFLYGSVYLSVVKDEPWNALKLLRKSEVNFPDDYWLNFYKGFNYYSELGDIPNAIIAYEKIINYPEVERHAPYLPSLLSKLKRKNENDIDLNEIFDFLLKFYNSLANHHFMKNIYHQNLYSIKAEIDLNCLNSAALNCDKSDFNDAPYIEKPTGEYIAANPWKPYRISKIKVRHPPKR